MLSERSQSEKATYCTILAIWHSKWVNYGYERSVLEIRCSGERDVQAEKENFQGYKNTLYNIKMRYTFNYRFSKPTECTTPKVNSKVNYGLWMILMCQHRSINCNRCSLWWVIMMMGDTKYIWVRGHRTALELL